MLHVLNGTETPSKGQVLINGIDIHKEPHRIEGVIGFVPQDDLIIEDLTVYQNLYFAAKLCFNDKTEAEIDALVLKVLEDLGLTETKDLKVGSPLRKTISGGQRKRLNIGLELLREPSVLFCDEPTSGLSSRDSENIIDLLKELSLKGKLVFTVIHQPSSDIFKKFVEITGAKGFHGVQAQLGEVIAWRNAFWALSDAMAKSAVPWNDMVRPDAHFAGAYRVLNQEAMPKIKNIIEQIVASGLIYLNSHTADFKAAEIRGYLDKYVRGSGGVSAVERVKVMKMLWDAIGTEFGARHELYEINYIGSNDVTRLTNLWAAQGSGNLDRFKAFAQSAMNEYDLDGWTVPDLVNPDDVSLVRRKPRD